MHTKRAELTEIFSSIQGEGIFLGAKQIFLRFKGCNRNCAFCDETNSAESRPYTSLELLTEVRHLDVSKGPHHSVSISGGEPLMQADFVKVFLNTLRRMKFKSYLETNGTLPKELEKVIELVDIIAMDFKLPSSTGEAECWDEHARFLKIASKKKVFIKMVVTSRTAKDEVEIAAKLIKETNAAAPLILQPVTPTARFKDKVKEKTLLEFMELASKSLENVRAIPQMHKMLGIK